MLKTYPPPVSDPSARVVWVDLRDPTREEAEAVARDYRIRVPSRDALQEIETSSRLRAEGRTLYASMPLSTRDEAAGFAPVPLGFVLTPDVLVTVRYSDLRAFTSVEERATEVAPDCSAAVFVMLVESLVDFGADTLEALNAALAAVSARTFARHAETRGRHKRISQALRLSLDEVGAAGDHLSRVRESLLGLQRITGFVAELTTEWFPAELKTRLQTARQDLNSLVDYEGHLFAKSQFLLDAILGLISTEQNEIFKVLTIVSVVGVPPTLIASLYGMNFHAMPELGWRYGYPYGLGLIALSTLLPIIWFKRRGWW
jgi:magnesium transporter